MKKFQKNRKLVLEHRLKLGEECHNEHNLVFTSEIGIPVLLRKLERRFYDPLLTTAGLPDIRLYDLRDSCATLLLAAGENPKVVSERLGHSTIVLTLDVYSQVSPAMQKEATKTFRGYIEKTLKNTSSIRRAPEWADLRKNNLTFEVPVYKHSPLSS